MPLSIADRHDGNMGDFWSDLARGATTFYRAVNPFVKQSGAMVELSGDLNRDATTLYRELNPVVSETGGAEFFGFTAIKDVPIIGGVLNATSDLTGIDWDTNKSPQMRVIVPIASAIGIGLLTAGIGSAIGGAIAGGTATAAGVAGAATGATIGGSIGQEVGKQIAQTQVNDYIARVQTESLDTQLATLKADSDSLQKAIDAMNADGETGAADAFTVIKKQLDEAIAKAGQVDLKPYGVGAALLAGVAAMVVMS